MIDAELPYVIILAGGEGSRLAPLTRALYGGDRPKQFAVIAGERSLLQTTIERATALTTLTLDQLERRRQLLDAGDDRYGRCAVCGADLGLAALAEMPWADRCANHAAQ